MTICCVAKIKDPKTDKYITVVGSDSEISDSTERLLGVVGASKVVKLNNAYVCISGQGPIMEAVEDLQEEPEFKLIINNKKDVRDLCSTIMSRMKEIAEEGVISNDIVEHLGLLLVAIPGRIFAVYNDLSVFEFEQFQTNGAGASIARGALQVHYNQLMLKKHITPRQLEDAVYNSIHIANTYTLGCGGKIYTYVL